jgi:phenylpropionate dioxygenase-like ring-hydroxylating dioxygenase large terminal subunit
MAAEALGGPEVLPDGRTLPWAWYVDPSVYELERERIFRRAWQYVGHTERLEQPGDYLTATLDTVPIVVVRDGDGELNGFVNVCRHRGTPIVEGAGRVRSLQCPYHAWTYGLDGRLRAAPRSDREPGFDKAGLSLVPVRLATWGPLVFATLDAEAPPLEEVLGDVPAIVDAAGGDWSSLTLWDRTELEVAANWKVLTEGGLECYHCPVAHSTFTDVIESSPDAYDIRSYEYVSSQVGHIKDANGRSPKRAMPYDTAGPIDAMHIEFVWPNLFFNMMPGRPNVMLLYFVPVSPGRTLSVTEYYFEPDAPPEYVRELTEFINVVGQEDADISERVQRGLRGNAIPDGRLLPDSELLIQHFNALVYRSLSDSTGPPPGKDGRIRP